jgi:2-methylisocitrate lyase-like PEP mutase family enzyme
MTEDDSYASLPAQSSIGRANRLRQGLRQRLLGAGRTETAIIAPGIYDGYGARMVAQAGFEAAYMTGNGVSACLLGLPDVGLVDLSMMANHARHVAACIDIPLICDADAGYGNVVGVRRTVEEFEAAGVAAIHIEDQVSPKRCAQLPGDRQVLDFTSALAKIDAAVAARNDKDFMVIARTDCMASCGMDEVLRRVQAFQRAGAGAVFVELKAHATILDDIRRISDSVEIPCMVNIDAGGPLSALHSADLHKHGVAIAIYPGLVRNTVGYVMQEALQHLRDDGSTVGMRKRMLSPREYSDCMGLPDVERWEARFPA